MKGMDNKLRPIELPVRGAWLDTDDAPEVALAAVMTAVVWLGCLTVGALGLFMAYPRPQSPAPIPSLITAEIVEAEVLDMPLTTSVETPELVASLLPLPLPALPVISEAPPRLAVAAPSPALAFALPVERPVRVTPPHEAAYAQPRDLQGTTAVAPIIPSPAQPLVFGRGEGKQPAPAYPPAAIRAGQEGTVRVRLVVGQDGRVLVAEVVAPSPWPLLNEAALRAVRQRWRFAPGSPRCYEVPIRFDLTN